jgi:hypothetical protein
LELARNGRSAEATDAARQWLHDPTPTPDILAAAAAVYAACVRAASSAADTTNRPAEHDALAQAAVNAARLFFEANPAAIDREYKRADFDPLRIVPAYAEMLDQQRHAANTAGK